MESGNNRIYAVKPKANTPGATRLVRAKSKTSALRHVAESLYDCGSASQDDMLKLAAVGGVKVEDATAE